MVAFSIRIDPSSNVTLACHKAATRIDYDGLKNLFDFLKPEKQCLQSVQSLFDGESSFELS